LFESRERRLFALLRFEGGMTTDIQALLKICRRHNGATIVAWELRAGSIADEDARSSQATIPRPLVRLRFFLLFS
jgi:hypothetical protein